MNGDAPQVGAGAPQIKMRLERIYLKDASWESPKSPQVFTEAWQPEIQVDINTRFTRLEDARFEVVLSVTLRAKVEGGKTAFIVEVQQAGLFAVEDAPDDMLQRLLATVCPATLFPYAREAVDSLALKGGFPALNLAPVNFDALYADALRKQEEQEGIAH